MKRTTLLTLTVLTGWAAVAAAQTSEPSDQPKATRPETQVRQGSGEVQKQDTGDPAARNPLGFVDADGDGICDNFQGQGRGRAGGRGAARGRRGRGPGDGTGNQGVGPRDGSGFGAGAGTGNCDGTGPKGRGRRGGRR